MPNVKQCVVGQSLARRASKGHGRIGITTGMRYIVIIYKEHKNIILRYR